MGEERGEKRIRRKILGKSPRSTDIRDVAKTMIKINTMWGKKRKRKFALKRFPSSLVSTWKTIGTSPPTGRAARSYQAQTGYF